MREGQRSYINTLLNNIQHVSTNKSITQMNNNCIHHVAAENAI